MKNNIYIGIDLSFSKTGLVIYNENKKTISLNLIVEDEKTKPIRNVNIFRYTYNTVNLIDDSYSSSELSYTNRAMKCTSLLLNIIKQNTTKEANVWVNMEGWKMDSVNSSRLFQLIMLQSMVRHQLSTIPNCRLKITNIGTLKKEFTGNGHAEKIEMIQTFFERWEGKKLLPNSTLNDTAQINDIVDAFALVCNQIAYNLHLNKPIIKKLKTRKKKIVKNVKKIADIF